MEVAERRHTRSNADIPWTGVVFWGIVLAGFICLCVFVIAPWMDRSNAAVYRHDNQELAAIHRLGFTKVVGTDIYNDGYNGLNYFGYQVGSCTTTIDVMRLAGQYKLYRTYILLKSVEDTRVFVTYQSLQKLPQMAGCFVK